MEVCGTHTMAIARAGLKRLLPETIRLVSGPGCPVCVTPGETIDYACRLAEQREVVICSFGDMIRVPGTQASLESYHPRVVYSSHDALELARRNPERRFVFIAVGFETTAPGIAATILEAARHRIKNLFILPALKTIPAALKHLAASSRRRLDGFILPGHVSAIIGEAPYRFLPEKYEFPSCITGFQPVEILRGILNLLKQIHNRQPAVGNEYQWVVRRKGNPEARRIMERVFQPDASKWRGLGTIPASGLRLRPAYQRFDIRELYPYRLPAARNPRGCHCAGVLLGLVAPADCPLFGRQCTPGHPVGPCMVSSEGACAAHYAYGGASRRRR